MIRRDRELTGSEVTFQGILDEGTEQSKKAGCILARYNMEKR